MWKCLSSVHFLILLAARFFCIGSVFSTPGFSSDIFPNSVDSIIHGLGQFATIKRFNNPFVSQSFSYYGSSVCNRYSISFHPLHLFLSYTITILVHTRQFLGVLKRQRLLPLLELLWEWKAEAARPFSGRRDRGRRFPQLDPRCYTTQSPNPCRNNDPMSTSGS